MTCLPKLDQMTPEQLRALAEQAMQLLSQVDAMGQKIQRLETVNEQLAHEIAILERHTFAKRSEQLSPDQSSLLDDLLDTEITAIEAELKAANPQAGARAAVSFSALVRTSARSSITPRACSPLSSMCVENGRAAIAKH